MNSADKKRIAFELMRAGVRNKDIARRLGVSAARVSQLSKEFSMRDESEMDFDDCKSERLVAARTRLVEAQARRLERQLEIDKGRLMRLDALQELVNNFFRHFKVHGEFIMREFSGEYKLWTSYKAALDGARRECEKNGWIPGAGVDDV